MPDQMSLDSMLDSPAPGADSTEPLRLRGRAGRLPTPLSIRSLTSGEVEAAAKGEAGNSSSPLVRISARHRRLAELVAEGMGTNEAAMTVGLTASRVSILKGDKTFQDLVAHCSALKERAFIATNERLAAVSNTALDIIQERLEADPDEHTMAELVKLSEMGADRTGFGPKKVEEKNINVNFGDALSAARKRAEASKQLNAAVEEATIIEVESP